ncbi:MAG: alpha/beta fold hydrolase [Bacteroidota bacterium]|nr:alpha/beta fold hydrolase [Bacteroidota bacterium]
MRITYMQSMLLAFSLFALAACNNPSPDKMENGKVAGTSAGQNGSGDSTDITWDSTAPAGMKELRIPSTGSLLQGFIYTPNGKEPHPTLLMLHGFPGNEKNLDLAQAVRKHGWNVVYFDYRGSWGSQGSFSFRHCVEDVSNVVAFCKQHADSLHIDTSRIALFGHSMGGWVCLQALRRLPELTKGFACSTWDLMPGFTKAAREGQLEKVEKDRGQYFVLNQSGKALVEAVLQDTSYHDLSGHAAALRDKKIFMLDEHDHNRGLADSIRAYNKAGFQYEVWKTDHPFTNKRQALIREVIEFLDK